MPDPMLNETRGPDGTQVLFGMLRRRKWLGILTLVGTFGAAASIVTFLPDIYRSAATVLIERQQIPEDLVKSTVTNGLDTRLPTITQQILSRSRLEGLINNFGLYADQRKSGPLESVIDQMRSDIEVDLRGGERRSDRVTIAFTVGYRGRDAQKVAQVANTLASFYIEENLKAREKQASGTADFLRAQVEELKGKLDEQEKQVTVFKEKYIGELPQQLDANLKTLEQLNSQLRLNADNQVKANERRAALATQLAETEGVVAPGGVNATVARLTELRKTLADLQTRYSDKYPDVVNVKGEIAALELRLQNGVAAAPASNPVPGGAAVNELRRALADAESEGRSLKLEGDRLRGSIAAYQQRVERAPKREQEFAALSRDYETSKELYRSLLVRQRESELSESMEQRQKGEQFRIIEPAVASESPAAPNRPKFLLYALVLSLGLAAVIMAVTEQLDQSFHSGDELRLRTGLLVMSIPPILSDQDVRTRRRRFALATTASVLGLVAVIGCSYLFARGNGQLSARLMPPANRSAR